MGEEKERGELDRLLTRKPRWAIRWGMSILFVVMALAFWVMKNVLAP